MTSEQIQSIPVEKGVPLLGILPKLLKGDPFEYLKNIMLEKGDFVKLYLGPIAVYLVSHPDYLQRILRDNYQNYHKPDLLYGTLKEIAANGLVVSAGDFWLRQRRMIQPHLHRKELANLFSEMVDAILEVINRWESLAQNGIEVELSEKMGEISSTIIMHTMFGKEILSTEELAGISKRAMRMVKYGGETLYSTMLPKWFPIPGKKQFREDLSATQEKINQIIVRCREDKETSASLIQMLINTVDEETHEQMDEQQLFDEVMTIFLAGYETTATALTWFGVVIQNYPDVIKKMRLEIDRVLQGRTPSYEDVPNLIYIRQVFMEILRMYNVVPFLPRSLNKADKLGNYDLPAKAVVLVFYHGVHHHPDIWDKPDVFDPERFTPERMAGIHPLAYLPFSAGPRKCAGDEFAMLEATLILTMILQKYEINILPNQTFTPAIGGTMRPAHGVKATFSIRNSA